MFAQVCHDNSYVVNEAEKEVSVHETVEELAFTGPLYSFASDSIRQYHTHM